MRLLLAIWAAKLSSVFGRLIGKKSSSSPGVIALKICPDIIRRLSKKIDGPIISVCGTNGKTTTNNLICTALSKCGKDVLCNKLGANMLGGIATTFAQKCSIFGKFHADCACLEIDEASTVRVFDHLTPDFMVVTNLFRDQLDRYGEIDITVNLLKTAMAKAPDVTMILNGDDPLCAQLAKPEKTYYFGVSEKVLPQIDETREGRFCVFCGAPLSYNYYHYSQLGDYYCESCGKKRPHIDFAATDVSLDGALRFSVCGNKIDLNYRGFYNIYNVLAVYAVLSLIRALPDNLNALLSDYKPQIGRMEEIILGGKSVILNLAKNPAGFNQAISTVMLDKRKKDVIVVINDRANDGRDVSWLWDVDFEKLSDGNLNTLTTSGIRLYDISLRFKYSDVAVDFIEPSVRSAILRAIRTDADVCYVLVNYTALFKTQTIMLDIKKELEEKGNELLS